MSLEITTHASPAGNRVHPVRVGEIVFGKVLSSLAPNGDIKRLNCAIRVNGHEIPVIGNRSWDFLLPNNCPWQPVVNKRGGGKRTKYSAELVIRIEGLEITIK